MSDANARLDSDKRDLLKKSAYVVPALLTLTAVPTFASAGSDDRRRPQWATRRRGAARRNPRASR